MSLPDNFMDLIQAEEVSFDRETSTVTTRYVAPACLTSPRGFLQGGFVAGFLDHMMGLASYHYSGNTQVVLNLEISMSLLRPVHVGPLVGKGRVIHMGKRTAFLEGELFDTQGELLARATSTAIPTPVPGQG